MIRPMAVLGTCLVLAACPNREESAPAPSEGARVAVPAPRASEGPSVGAPPLASSGPPLASADAPATPAAPGPPPAPAEFPPVGSKRTVEKVTSTSVRTMFQGRDVVIGNIRRETIEETILAAGDGAFRKLEVRYVSADRVRKMGDSDQRAATALSGNSYVVERKGAGFVVTTPSGAAVAPDIASEVRKDYGSLGQKDPLYGALPATLPEKGARVPRLEAALKQHFADLGDGKNVITIGEASATLESVTKNHLGFKVAIEVRMQASTQTFAAKLAGVYQARASDGWPTKIDVSGPADVTLFSSNTRSTGELAVRRTIRY